VAENVRIPLYGGGHLKLLKKDHHMIFERSLIDFFLLPKISFKMFSWHFDEKEQNLSQKSCFGHCSFICSFFRRFSFGFSESPTQKIDWTLIVFIVLGATEEIGISWTSLARCVEWLQSPRCRWLRNKGDPKCCYFYAHKRFML